MTYHHGAEVYYHPLSPFITIHRDLSPCTTNYHPLSPCVALSPCITLHQDLSPRRGGLLSPFISLCQDSSAFITIFHHHGEGECQARSIRKCREVAKARCSRATGPPRRRQAAPRLPHCSVPPGPSSLPSPCTRLGHHGPRLTNEGPTEVQGPLCLSDLLPDTHAS
jgi:hypothetical protein